MEGKDGQREGEGGKPTTQLSSGVFTLPAMVHYLSQIHFCHDFGLGFPLLGFLLLPPTPQNNILI